MKDRFGEVATVSKDSLHTLRSRLDELQRLEPGRGDFLTSFERVRRELQSIDARLQFVEVKELLPFMKQLAKDAVGKRKLGVQIEFNGESLGLPRDTIDVLQEIFVHLVRNSVDHGGKGKKVLSLKVQCSIMGGQVEILFQDNGSGVDWGSLKKRAQKLGVTADHKKLLALLFLPGFSTRSKTTRVSGRGIGLSAVRSSIRKLSGRVEPVELKKGFGVRLLFPVTEFGAWVRLVEVEGKSFFLPQDLHVETESGQYLHVQVDSLVKSVKHDFRVFHLCTPQLIGSSLSGSNWFLNGERGFASRVGEKKLALIVSNID